MSRTDPLVAIIVGFALIAVGCLVAFALAAVGVFGPVPATTACVGAPPCPEECQNFTCPGVSSAQPDPTVLTLETVGLVGAALSGGAAFGT